MPRVELTGNQCAILTKLLREKEFRAHFEHHQQLCIYFGSTVEFNSDKMAEKQREIIADCDAKIQDIENRLELLQQEYAQTQSPEALSDISVTQHLLLNSQKTRQYLIDKATAVEDFKCLAEIFERTLTSSDDTTS